MSYTDIIFCLVSFWTVHSWAACPKLIKQHVVPCNFSQFYYSLPLSRVSSQQGFIQLTYELWHLPCMFSVLFMTVHHILYFSPHDPIITEPRKAAGEVQLPDYIQVRWGKASEDWALGHGQTDLTSPSPTQTCSVSAVLHRWRTQTACCNSPLSWKVCNAFIYWILACIFSEWPLLTIIVIVCFNRDMYRCARSSDWGDLLPMFHAEDDDTKNDKMQWNLLW